VKTRHWGQAGFSLRNANTKWVGITAKGRETERAKSIPNNEKGKQDEGNTKHQEKKKETKKQENYEKREDGQM